MNLKNIKHLRSIDLLNLLLYSSLGLTIPMMIFALILVLFGVPVTFNEIDKYGLEAILYLVLFLPLGIVVVAFVFWLYIACGWKIARWLLQLVGKY